MSGAGVIADGHLVGVITVDPARYQDRLVAVPVSRLLADPGFRAGLAAHGMRAEAAPVGAAWYLRLPGEQTVTLAPAYRPVSRRFGLALPTLLRPEHGLVPFLGRQDLLDQITSWCQGPAGRPLLLVTGSGGSGKTRLGREACVQMQLVAAWDAGLADDQRRDGTATTRLQRPTLLVVDDADLRTGLISALVEYLRWDDAGPSVRLLLLARAAGTWWDRLVRQQELASSYTGLDLDRHPVPPAGRTEHFRCASTAFAAYRGPEAPRADVPLPTGLDDPAYADPLLIHIAALLRTVDTSATPPPPGPAEERAAEEDSTAGMPVRQALLQALCERERDRWYQLGSHLSFNPDLPVVDQVVALATLTAAGDQPCATSLMAALPNQAEVTRIGAEALVVWAHRLYSGPGYWNPLRPDLLAEQHLADTAQLAPLAAAAAQLAAGQGWEAGLFTRLLAELTRGAPTHPAIQAALSELFAAALPRIVDLAVTGGHAGLADLASLALQLAPQPHQAPLVTKFANFLGEEGREGQAIQVLETTIAAAEGDPAVPASDLLAMRWILAWHVGGKTGGRGDPQRALEIARAVVRDSTAVHGPAHRETLDATITLARQVGATGNPRQALAIAREVDATATAAFGAGDETTLNARFEVAVWVDGAAAGAERFAELIRQAEQLEPRRKHLIAASMWNLAGCLSEAGDHARAIKASEEAISLARQLYGATHIKVLERRLTHADVVGESGDPQAAADLSGHLADECADIIGESHQTTLETRYAAARWTAATGDHTGAARRYQALLADLAGVLGDDHWLAQECRIELAELKEHPGPPHGDEPAPGARRKS
jgi:tetratricopeptide (TPR) repeat protein